MPNPLKNLFIMYIMQRIRKNKNLLIAIVGETGSGKSYAALSLARAIDKDFGVNKIIFTYTDLIKVAEERRFRKGSCVVFDEVSAEALQARDFMSKKNKNLSALLQTFRNLNYIVIFTSPDMSYIDKQARRLMHLVMVTSHINYESEYCSLKIYMLSINRVSGKVYYKFPTWVYEGTPYSVEYISLPKPPEPIITVYERKKRKFQKRLYARLRRDFSEPEEQFVNKKAKD